MAPLKPKSNVRSIPYVRGFHRPTRKRQLLALGTKSPPIEYELNEQHFNLLPACVNAEDWLANNYEGGQTFDEFRSENPWFSRRKRRNVKMEFNATGKNIVEKYPAGKLYLLPLGDLNDGEFSVYMKHLASFTQRFYQIPVIVLPMQSLKADKASKISWVCNDGNLHPLTSRHNNGKTQIQVYSILNKMKSAVPSDALCMVALTMYDLYADKPDLFIAGMADGSGRVAVFSFFRYQPDLTFSSEFWHESRVSGSKKDKDVNNKLMLHRCCRLLVHELGHLLGLDHCIYFACLMNGSGHLTEDFSQPMFLCPIDLRKLQSLCGFDVIARYEDLLHFCQIHSFTDEMEWLEKRLEYLKGK